MQGEKEEYKIMHHNYTLNIIINRGLFNTGLWHSQTFFFHLAIYRFILEGITGHSGRILRSNIINIRSQTTLFPSSIIMIIDGLAI